MPQVQAPNIIEWSMEHYVPKQACLDWCESRVFSGTADAFVKIVRYEGATSLYNGLAPTLTMAIPATVLYFATFDKLNMKFKDMGLGTNASPVLAGSMARLIAASFDRAPRATAAQKRKQLRTLRVC